MKAIELMIGDWVFVDSESTKVEEIDSSCINTTYYCSEVTDFIDEEEISPIPLTPELLESNGWIRHNSCYFRWWEYNDSSLHIEMNDQNINIWLDYDGGSYSDYLLPTPKYVHELQHIFRLCKLIDNFVVKNE